MKIKASYLSVFIFLSFEIFSQGLINNGANIVFSGASQLYIDGATGHYTNQSAGLITPSASSTITLLGDWLNNSSPANTAFSADGGGVVLAGAAQSIGGSAATAFYDLTLAGSGVKTLAVNSNTVGGQSTFAGVLAVGASTLDLNSNTLNVTNSATGAITRSSGYIISETNSASNPSYIRWYHRTVSGSKTYPFGVAGSYIPFTLNIISPMPGASDYVEVSTRTTGSNNQPWASGVTHMYSPNVPYADGTIPAVVDRWWQVNNSAAVTANATFSYRGSENTLNALYSSGLIGAQYWASAWLPNNSNIGSAAIVSSGVGSVTASGLSTFGPWVLTALLSPLPIELINFDGQCVNTTIALNWCTASEANNDYFTVQQSADGSNFTDITKIYGNGTTDEKHCYNYAATSLSADVNYFRLKQTDKNGQSKTSAIISVASCDKANGHIVIANSGSKDVSVILTAAADQKLQLYVHNTLGQIIETTSLQAFKGYNNINVNLDDLANAIYYISIYNTAGEQVITKKIVVSDLNR